MDIKNITTATAKVKDLHPNTGQLEPMGVHANPRQISDEKFEKLRKSLDEHNLLGVLPIKAIRYNDEWVVIGGNMRVRALMANGREDEEVEFIVVPENSDAQTIEGLILGDNAQFGDWDMQELGNWSEETLAKWDVDVEKFGSVFAPNLNPSDDGDGGRIDFDAAQEHINHELLPNDKKLVQVECPHCGNKFSLKL